MDNIDKTIVTVIVVVLAIVALLSWGVVREIEKYGGPKQIIIDTGKEVKDIIEEINKD